MTRVEKECMDNPVSVERVSALAGHYIPGKTGILGADGVAGVVLEDIAGLVLHQVACWQDSLEQVGKTAASAAGVKSAPGPCRAAASKKGAILRIEPMKWWVYGVTAPELKPQQGATLDLSHSRTHIRMGGPDATEFLNRFLPLDLREDSFPVGAVASSVIHHVGVTLWRSGDGYEMFVPRGFALSLWQGFVEVAEQFGLEVK